MDYKIQAEQAKHRAELELEEAGLLSRLAEIQAIKEALAVDPDVKKNVTATSVPEVVSETILPKPKPSAIQQEKAGDETGVVDVQPMPKRRGRPPIKNAGNANEPKEKRIELPSLLETIIQSHGKPMKHEELVIAARNAGYRSDAKDFSNMVYQCLIKLVKKGTLNKDNEGKDAEYTFRAA